jgi:hypothetical protein
MGVSSPKIVSSLFLAMGKLFFDPDLLERLLGQRGNRFLQRVDASEASPNDLGLRGLEVNAGLNEGFFMI